MIYITVFWFYLIDYLGQQREKLIIFWDEGGVAGWYKIILFTFFYRPAV